MNLLLARRSEGAILERPELRLIILIVVLLWVISRCVRIVPQASVQIIERLGAYKSTWQTGIHFKVPFIERVKSAVSMKEQVADFEPQAVITKDNVTMQIDTVVFYQVTDPVLYTYGIERPILAIENLSATTLRNIIGDLELDETLTSRDLINGKMRIILDEATDPWGIKVNRVELKNILPPKEIRNAMEKQMKAEREKREMVRMAEAEKESKVRVAEGEKQAQILQAEGEAEAMLTVARAKMESLNLIKSVEADHALIALRSLDALEKVADGKATKLIIPSEIQNLTSLISAGKIAAETKENGES
ncbi:MAG: SPFH domain-containing protein [Eubacteriales bacterium]|nr:SPFH domain-containing protein [Eubacteriales bacterium]